MGLLRFDVLEWISRVRQKPVLASDPDELRMLEQKARADWGGSFAAQNSAIAPYTWEQRIILPAATAQTTRINFRLPFAVEIVGFIPTLEDTQVAAGGIIPSLNSVDVQIDLNSNEFLTTANGVTTTAAPGQLGGTFVTLSTISLQAQRLFAVRMLAPNPDLGFTFRWKRGAGVYRDTLITIAMLCRRIGTGTAFEMNPSGG